MGKINVLDKFTAEKIAAGEVVGRPANVIKELVENSIDACATSVTIEIKNGGTRYMRVTDNGSGMDSADARRAFLRHATSKIKTDSDLESILTLGFRGEALASVCAVSHTELFTKQPSSECGTHIVMEGGQEVLCENAGCPDGTTVVVKDLFFNTPARMKFMKKDSAEAAAITDIVNKQALSHPDVSLRLIRDGKEVLFTPGDSNLKNTVRAIFGKDISNAVTDVLYESGGINVEGVIGKNNLSRPNRLMQIFFVNKRYVINKTLYTAIAEAYKNELMGGHFPVAFLNITINPSLVDANVHPEKTEIKFADEKSIYEAVYWAVKNALSSSAAPREAVTTQAKNAFKLPLSSLPQKQITIQEFKKTPSKSFTPFSVQAEKKPAVPTQDQIREAVLPYNGKLPVRSIEGADENTLLKNTDNSLLNEDTKKAESLPSASFSDARVIGQLFNTYILAEGDGEFFLMDQHAAHERIRYEEILKSGSKADTQLLLMPLTINLTPTEKQAVLDKSDFLLEMGFQMEDFGKNAVMLTSLPADCPYEDGEALFIELIGILMGNEGGSTLSVRERAVYTVACHSAIRANQPLTYAELCTLYKDAAALEGITTCPHGRPITVKLTKYQIEKMFGRIV